MAPLSQERLDQNNSFGPSHLAAFQPTVGRATATWPYFTFLKDTISTSHPFHRTRQRRLVLHKMRLRSHTLTISNLPPEVLHRIGEVLDAIHPRSLVAFAQTSKHLYAVASRLLYRTLKITLTDREGLAKEVQRWESALSRDEGLKYVRRLILRGYDLEQEPRHHPYLSLASCERSDHDTDLESCWDLYLYYFDVNREFRIEQADWELLAPLLNRLTGLTDLFFACHGPFPPLLLHTLHQDLPKCRLHHYTFRLSASDEASLPPEERALITSPCLFSVGNLMADTESDVAYRVLARRNAPSLRRVFSLWHRPEWYENALRDIENRTGLPDPPALEHLQFFDDYDYQRNTWDPLDSALPRSVLDKEVLHDYSALRVLKINTQMADQMLPAPGNFPSLVTFSISCPSHPLDPDWATHLLSFLHDLPRLTTLRVLHWYHSIPFTPGLNPRLQELHLDIRTRAAGGKPLLEDHIYQLADRCPAMEALTIQIKRSRGDAAEVARYRALGRLPWLRRLTLKLDASPPPIIPDDIIQNASRENGPWRPYFPWPGHTDVEPWFEEGWDCEIAYGLSPYRKGHVRDALVNSAIDSDLALAIFRVIDAAKQVIRSSGLMSVMEIQSLERVEISTFGDGSFPQVGLHGPPARGFQENLSLVKRKWVVERDVRDDSRDVLHVHEIDKGERMKAEARCLGRPQPGDGFREIWHRAWPANIADGTGDWWREWTSRPLELHTADR